MLADFFGARLSAWWLVRCRWTGGRSRPVAL